MYTVLDATFLLTRSKCMHIDFEKETEKIRSHSHGNGLREIE